MNVAIVTSGFLPVPPSKGGAVESLVQYLVDENERQEKMNLVIYSSYDAEAEKGTASFHSTEIRFIRTPLLLRAADRFVYFCAKSILRKEKHLSYRYILQRLHFIYLVGRDLAKSDFDRVVFENHPTLLGTLKIAGNREHYAGRYLYHMHNELSGFFGCEREFLGCRRVMGVSRFILETLYPLCGNALSKGSMYVLKNRVDADELVKAATPEAVSLAHKRYGIPDGAKVVLFAGRLCQEKGALELIEAFTRLKTKDSILLIAGSYYFGSGMRSAYEEQLEDAAKSLGSRILFTGFVPHSEMGVLYALADVVVVPSIWEDPAPLSVVEPLTLGCPLVTTRRGGIPEYATDGVDSIVLEIGESLTSEIAQAIDAILSGEIVLRKCGSYDLTISSFYRDFLRLIAQDETGVSKPQEQRQHEDGLDRLSANQRDFSFHEEFDHLMDE